MTKDNRLATEWKKTTMHKKSQGSSQNAFWFYALLFVSCLGANIYVGPQKFSITDAVLLVIVFYLFINSRFDVQLNSTIGLGKFLSFAVLYLGVGLLSSLFNSGGETQVLKDAVSITYFLVALAVLGHVPAESLIERLKLLVFFVTALTAFMLATSGESVRSSGWFNDPNLAASLCGTCIVLAIVLWNGKQKLLTLSALLLGGWALLATNGLGASLALVIALGYWFSCKWAILTRLIFISLVSLSGIGLVQLLASQSSTSRYESSSQARFRIWQGAFETWLNFPFGVGISTTDTSTFSSLSNMETHNDFLAALLANGFIGLILFVLLLIAAWQLAGYRSRTLIVFYLVSALTINAFNFRHIWVALAALVVVDTIEKSRKLTLISQKEGSQPLMPRSRL